ncbi:MAG TPA: ArsI/CadI family heavy metal resistance metalloenzyme [Candidatus Baltobacteraceae bacterium]|nr:ArsI/CadI family heavy metal resistance metalloenzyme [Candidatus Baltobacteraceae bacterium]
MKMHLNFATRDLHASVAFYTTLLGAQPAKRRADYALFVSDRPALELALDLDGDAHAEDGPHFGIVVDSVEDVAAQTARLRDAGYATEVERERTCCYANQTKVWATDPDGRRWETYVVHAETRERDDPETTCCGSDAAAPTPTCCG